MSLDINELASLFHIHSEASKHGDSFKNIKAATWTRLKEMDAEHAPPQEDKSPSTVEPVPETEDDSTKESPNLTDRRF